MKFVGRTGVMASALAFAVVMGSGLAFAHDHGGPLHFEQEHAGTRVVVGAYDAGAVASLLTASTIQIQTKTGSDVTVYLTSNTRVNIAANGTAGGLLKAISEKRLMVNALVQKKQGHWVAVSISAHVNSPESEQGDSHQHHDG